jgi:hypothetical protein
MTSTQLRNEARAMVRTLPTEVLIQLARHESQYPRYVEDIAQTELIRRNGGAQRNAMVSQQSGIQRIPLSNNNAGTKVVSYENATNPPDRKFFAYRREKQVSDIPQTINVGGVSYTFYKAYKTKNRADLDGKKSSSNGYKYRIVPFVNRLTGFWEYALYVRGG